MIALIGTFDVSQRLASHSEMKEAAAHVGEQAIEEMRALDYGELALNGDPSPGSSSDVNNPAHYLGADGVGREDLSLGPALGRPGGPYRAARHRRHGRHGPGDGRGVERRPPQGKDLPLRHVRVDGC